VADNVPAYWDNLALEVAVKFTSDGQPQARAQLQLAVLDAMKRVAPPLPAVPEEWVLVPREPAEDMVVSGFESEPDEVFSPPEEWEAYEAMSGCRQAAHRARLCYLAMLAAAPSPEQGGA
jgi:hypothetical protein